LLFVVCYLLFRYDGRRLIVGEHCLEGEGEGEEEGEGGEDEVIGCFACFV
jgi:hypothetical protein